MTILSQVSKTLLIRSNIKPHYEVGQIELEQNWIKLNRMGYKKWNRATEIRIE